MSVRNAGLTIREARLKAGLSQEKLSDGICSTLSLSRIENGTAGVSPSTFQALMAHAGVPCEVFPTFMNRTDFDCFYTLKRARFYLDCWQLEAAYKELDKIENLNFAKNKYYYQEWLLLHCKLQYRSGCGNHSEIYNTLLDALHISRPNITLSDFRDLLLSLNEIELLIALAQESLYLDKSEICNWICTQISTYLMNSQITFLEKDRFLAENAIVFSKYLFINKDYSASLKVANAFRQKMIKNSDNAPLHELTFLTALGHYHTENNSVALALFKTAFFSAHSIGSCYATTIYNYIFHQFGISLLDSSLDIPEIPLVSYASKKAMDTTDFSDGTYDLFSSETLTLGSLIRELRSEQNISQQTLCSGLCSKSKLSKIENNTLQPDIALSQSLLQRLGISDYIFTFYGNTHESTLQNLRLKLTYTRSTNVDEILKYSEEMLKICSDKDTFYIQYASYRKALCIPDSNECAIALLQALKLTLPDFDFNYILNYRLSWLELTILNNYCDIYCQIAPSKGILYLYKLLDYYNYSNMDILGKKRVSSIHLCFLCADLYIQRRFTELIELAPLFSSPEIKCSLHSLGVVFANYAQALGEVQEFNSVPLFFNYAYYNLLITNSTKNAELLKEYIYADFNISLV